MSKKGSLVVISGFSGAGKGTIVKRLLSDYDCYAISVSVTTRSPRPGEQDGVDYFFRTREEFEQMVKEDQFYEHAMYVSNCYGTPKEYVDKKLSEGKDVILEIEVQGALNMKQQCPDALLLFVTPPSAAELRNRLTSRGTETEAVISERMKTAAKEAGYMDKYDYLVINDDLDICVKEVHQLIQREHSRMNACLDFVDKIQNELNEMKGKEN